MVTHRLRESFAGKGGRGALGICIASGTKERLIQETETPKQDKEALRSGLVFYANLVTDYHKFISLR